MAITVSSGSSNSITIGQGNRSEAAVTIKKGGDLTLQGLSNVVSTDLQDGYTLVYDSVLNKWVAQQIDSGGIQSVDGGTY